MAIRKRFRNTNGEIGGVIKVDVGALRYRICLLENGEMVAEKSGLVTSWLTGNLHKVSIAGEYFAADVSFTHEDVLVTWTYPEEDEEEGEECSRCVELAENECRVRRCRRALFCDSCWDQHNTEEHKGRAEPLRINDSGDQT